MKRGLVVLTLVSVFCAGIGCKNHEASTAPTTAAMPLPPDAEAKSTEPKDPLPHPLFWAIEKDGKTTFVLGTMHIGIDADDRLPTYVWTRFHAATTFAM